MPDVLAELAGEDIGDVLRRLGQLLRRFHDTPTAGCPWVCGVDELVETADSRVRRGLAAIDRFDPPFRRYAPSELLELVHRSVPPPAPSAVMTHGAARLDAVRLDGAELRWTGVEGSGVGDPYRDLATMAVDLAAAIGPEALAPFLDAYGIDQPDLVRLDWHVLVDQLVR